MSYQSLIFGVVLFFAGIGIPIMASLNAGLGTRLGSPVPAALVLFSVAALLTATLMLRQPLPSKIQFLAVPAWHYLGAVFIVFYILSITHLAPRIGLANAIFLILFGQLTAAVVIDHFGLLNAIQTPITATRVIGLGLMAIGIFCARG